MAQSVGPELHIIDYIENRQKPLGWYLAELQSRPYIYAIDWLPHDSRSQTLAAPMSVERLLRDAGRQVQIVPRHKVEDGINAGRTVFSRIWVDNDKCADLVQCLRHYRYDVDPNTGKFSNKPLHDDYSNGADAFRYFAICSQDLTPRPKPDISFETQFTQGSQETEGFTLTW
jgi:phage terminase large subunit